MSKFSRLALTEILGFCQQMVSAFLPKDFYTYLFCVLIVCRVRQLNPGSHFNVHMIMRCTWYEC